MIERLISGSAITLISFACMAQSTPEDLGKEVFNAFQIQDLELLNAYFPDPAAILAKTRGQGIEFTPEQEIDFIKNFPLQINRYKHQCSVMLETELAKSVNWATTVFSGSGKVTRIVPVPVDTSKTLEDTDILIHFKDNSKDLTLTLSECFELNDRWYLGGGHIILSEK